MSNQIPHEFEADTMQVPRGQFSVLWELQNQGLTNAEAIIYLCSESRKHVEFRSNVVHVGSILIKDTRQRHVQKLCAKDTIQSHRQRLDRNN